MLMIYFALVICLLKAFQTVRTVLVVRPSDQRVALKLFDELGVMVVAGSHFWSGLGFGG